MNFPTFGSHFSATIPNIHQFSGKLQDVSPLPPPFSSEDDSLINRYTANGIPSFTQHHHAVAHQQFAPTKPNGTYPNSPSLYGHGQNIKRHHHHHHHHHQAFDQQNFDVFSVKSPIHHQENGNNKKREIHHQDHSKPSSLPLPWQNLTAASPAVVDYLSQLPANSIPLSLHDFLKYSAESLKKESMPGPGGGLPGGLPGGNDANMHFNPMNANAVNGLSTINAGQLHGGAPIAPGPKKKKKKKTEKEKKPKPKPGEIRLSTALDGSTLYCCPECHMALPERELLEQHLIGHNMERRFVCDICGAALKRKDHLTRHKQSHNPERPFVCSVCMKAFKRKEQLTLHFVIHSGEKRHVCTECGKGFYRKDHLRKHTRSHIARRVKAELSQQGGTTPVGMHSVTS